MLTPAQGVTLQQGTTATVTWRSFGFTGMVDLSYSEDGGNTFVPIATGVPTPAAIAGSIGTNVPQGSGVLLKVAAESAAVSGLSAPFTISGANHSYYINDNSQAGDQYTTAVGNDANDGLTPATPKATHPGAAGGLHAGRGRHDLCRYRRLFGHHVDHADQRASGQRRGGSVRHRRPDQSRRAPAVLNRGNTASGTTVFTVNGASYVTLQNLTIENADIGVSVWAARSAC